MGKTEPKLEIDADLLAQAEAANVPLSAAAEAGLRMALEDRPRPKTISAAHSNGC